MEVNVIGGGLAGSEAALTLAKNGIKVNLYEMRPNVKTGAHKTSDFAEFVCSNSLGSFDITNASGLLKKEILILGSSLIKIAFDNQVPAGNALAIDREMFSKVVSDYILSSDNINVIREEIKSIPSDFPTIIASGPLTSSSLASDISNFLGHDNLAFFDAIAPIIEKDSIDFSKAFFANRYNKGDACYINCPMDKDQYLEFYNYLIKAETIELKSFEKNAKFFESCMPIEVMASRGVDTLRYGPLKPVGLIDPRNNIENYAVVQLRQDNLAKSLYNMVGFQTNLKWGAQKELIRLIPGLENAHIIKFGVMHRNMFINSPKVLNPTLQSLKRDDLFFSGQITGTEGYTESIATGLLAALNMIRLLHNKPLLSLPQTTMLGALTHYISFKDHKNFQPINSNWGIVEHLSLDKKLRKDKKLKNQMLADRSIQVISDLVL